MRMRCVLLLSPEVFTMHLLTAKETAAILKVTLPRVYELAREGLIPSVRMGRQIRFDETKLLNWIEQGGSVLQKAEARNAA
jgi:putative molybdopterin biosynthesis protein